MAYTALYRKYRPTTFKDVYGQEVIVKILTNSIIKNKVGHAYLFVGTRGTGKTSVAKIFAKAVNCECNKDGDACNECNTCKSLENNEIDIIEIDAASNNGVEEIREIRNNTKLVPSVGKYKVYIIDEIHMLSTGAFNALLKTLEEPPAHVIFILATTEMQKIPLTVLSRCQRFDFKKISNSTLLERLKYIVLKENKVVKESILKLIVELGDGSFRDAINLLDQVIDADNVDESFIYKLSGSVTFSEINEFLKIIINREIKLVLDKINYFVNEGINLTIVAEKLLLLMRDISINNTVNNYFEEDYSKILDYYFEINIDKINNISKILLDLILDLKKSINQKVVFEIYIIKIINVLSNNDEDQQKKEIKEKKIISREIILEESKDFTEKSDLKNIRINNTLATADKNILNLLNKKMLNVEKYISNKKYTNIVKILLDTKIVCSGESNLILMSDTELKINTLNDNISKVESLFKEMLDNVYKIVIVSCVEWENIKKEFVENKKKNKKYEIISEKNIISKKEKKIIENEAINLFGEEVVSVK